MVVKYIGYSSYGYENMAEAMVISCSGMVF